MVQASPDELDPAQWTGNQRVLHFGPMAQRDPFLYAYVCSYMLSLRYALVTIIQKDGTFSIRQHSDSSLIEQGLLYELLKFFSLL